MSPENSQPEDSKIKQRIEEVSEEYLKRLRSGEQLELKSFVEEHPDLAPHLEERIRILQAVFVAQTASTSGGDSEEFRKTASLKMKTVPHEQVASRIRCPHCGYLVQLVETLIGEISCNGCGSSVDVLNSPDVFEEVIRIPEEIDRFLIKRVLGQGSFGVVYLAWDPNLDREVALKIPRQGFFLSDEEEQRFFREARNAAKLQHPHIVSVHEVSITEQTPFIVTEFIDGVTLDDLALNSQLKFKDIAALMVKVCEAVAFAHDNGILHRDLKPSNILVDHQNNPFISDFGLARRDDAEITMTMDGTVLGTPAYMSPEQASGEQKSVGFHSDVYSLGVILYKLICNELPYSGSRRKLLYQVVNNDPVNPTTFKKSIPKDLETITLTAMSKDVSRRYKRAEELKEELECWVNGKPIKARPVSRFEKSVRWCKRNPSEAALVFFVGFMAIASSLFFWSRSVTESRLKKEANDKAEIARALKVKSDQNLLQSYKDNGFAAMKERRFTDSAHWFSQALNMKDDSTMRLRCGMVFDRMPKLTAMIPIHDKINQTKICQSKGLIAFGTWGGKVIVYDTNESKKLMEVKSDGIQIFNLDFMGDGKYIIFRYGYKKLRVWNLEENKLYADLFFDSSVRSFYVNGKRDKVAIVSNDLKIQVWDSKTKETSQIIEFQKPNVFVGAGELGEDQIFFRTTERSADFKSTIGVLNMAEKRKVFEKNVYGGDTLEFSPSGSMFALVDPNNQIKIWSTKDGKQIGKTFSVKENITKIRFDRSEENLFLFVDNSKWQSYDIATGSLKRVHLTIPFDPTFCEFVPVENLVIATSHLGDVFCYDFLSGKEIGLKLARTETSSQPHLDPTGTLLGILATDGNYQVWDLSGTEPDHVAVDHNSSVRNALFVPGSTRAVSFSIDGQIKIWNTRTGTEIHSMVHEGGIFEGQVSTNGNWLVTGGQGKTAKVWNTSNGKEEYCSPVLKNKISEAVFSNDSNSIAVGCEKGQILCWGIDENGRNGKLRFSVKHGNSEVNRLIFSSDDRYLISAGSDGSVRIWDANTGQPAFGPFERKGFVLDCLFDEERKELLTARSDGTLTVENVENREVIQEFKFINAVFDLSWIEGGGKNRFLSTDGGEAIRMWNRGESGYTVTKIFRDISLKSILSSQYDPAHKIVASAGGINADRETLVDKGSVVLWDPADGTLVGPPLKHGLSVRRARFKKDSNLLLTASEDGTARVYSLNSVSIPPADFVEIMKIYTGIGFGEVTGDNQAAGTERLKKFNQFKKKYPKYFSSNSRKRSLWRAR